MTTVVVDLTNQKIVTDSRCTGNRKVSYTLSFFKKKLKLPFFKFQECVSTDDYTVKSVRINKNGFTEYAVGSGTVQEIKKFIKNYSNDTIPKKFLKDSTVLVVSFNGYRWVVKSYSNSTLHLYGSDVDWITSGSGSQLSAAAMDMISEENRNRAEKAVEVAINRDTYSGGEIRTLQLQDYCDIY
jgi:hypothetical protein